MGEIARQAAGNLDREARLATPPGPARVTSLTVLRDKKSTRRADSCWRPKKRVRTGGRAACFAGNSNEARTRICSAGVTVSTAGARARICSASVTVSMAGARPSRLPACGGRFRRHPVRRCADPRAPARASIDDRRLRSANRMRASGGWRVRLQPVDQRARETQPAVPVPTLPARGSVRAAPEATRRTAHNCQARILPTNRRAPDRAPVSAVRHIRRNRIDRGADGDGRSRLRCESTNVQFVIAEGVEAQGEPITDQGWLHVGSARSQRFLKMRPGHAEVVLSSGGRQIGPQQAKQKISAVCVIRLDQEIGQQPDCLTVGEGDHSQLAMFDLQSTE